MTAIETIADVLATPSSGLSTGLPQLDRVAPLGPGHLAVLIGASGVGKSRVAGHIIGTLACTHDHGVLTVTTATTIDALDSSLTFRNPALVVIDPLTAVTNAEAGATDPEVDQDAEQGPVHPAELGRVAERLRGVASRHELPILACHRYTPIRDSVTAQIVSTESANPLLDQADLVAVVRVLADPQQIGLELLRNRLGPLTTLRIPLPAPQDKAAERKPASRAPSARS